MSLLEPRSGAMTVFGPLREDDLLALMERETALVKAVDARYARLRPEVDPEERGFPTLGLVLDRCGHHAADMAEFTGMLAALNSADYLRVRRQTHRTTTSRHRCLRVRERAA